MTLAEQIKVLCAYSNLTQAELARRFGTSPQNFNFKLKHEKFYLDDLKRIAELTDSEYHSFFVRNGGQTIE